MAVVLQMLVGAWVVRSMSRRGADPVQLRSTAIAFAAVVLSALILVPIGRSVPDAILVLLVAVAAYRVARLRLDRTVPRTPVRRFVGQAVMFAWSVAVIATETEVTTRPGGFLVAVLALFCGLVVLVTLSHDGTLAGRLVRAPVVAAIGLAFLAALAVLIPSEQSAHWLHTWNFQTPAEFAFAGERYEDGDLKRWYDTPLDPIDAQLAAHEGFSGIVSEWAGPEPLSINGHVWGYRLDVRVWAVGIDGPRSESLPSDRLCKTETGTCVLVELRRSDDLDDGHSTPLILGE